MSLMEASLTPVAVAVSLLTISVITFVVRKYSVYKTWSRQGIPGPNPWIGYLTVIRIFFTDFMKLEQKRIEEFGKVYGVIDVGSPMLVVSDPDILKDMLVRNFSSFSGKREMFAGHRVFQNFLTQLQDDEWRQTRAIISPTFTSGKMKAMFPLISDAVKTMMDRLEREAGQEFDLKSLFGCLTMDIIAKCAFAIDTNAHADTDNPFVSHARRVFQFSMWKILLVIFLPKRITGWLQLTGSDNSNWDYLESLAQQMIAERRKQMKQGIKRAKYNDFLQLMIEAGTHDAVVEEGAEHEEHEIPVTKGKTLSDQEIVSNTILVLIAGYETTASLLTFATYSLACDPEVQQRLFEEVVDAGKLDYDTVTKLTYLDAVINETLRKFPPVLRVDRQVSDKNGYSFDCHLGKVHMPPGSGVFVPIYAMHHTEEYFPNPEKFDPERFMPENKEKLVPYSFAPFVMGPRNCVGMRFALLEAKMTLATLVKDYRFTKSPKTDEPLDLSKSIIILAPKRVIVKIEKRNSE